MILMKKRTVISLALLGTCSVLAFFILFFCFGEDLQIVVQETMYAILTGCIFAIPSTSMILIIDGIKNRNREYKAAYILEEILQELGSQVANQRLSTDISRQYIDKIALIHTQFNDIAVNYLFLSKRHRDYLRIIQIQTFDILAQLYKISNQTSPSCEVGEIKENESGQGSNWEKVNNCLTTVQCIQKILGIW